MATLENYWNDDTINTLVEKRIARDTTFKQTNSDRLGWLQVVTDLKKEGGAQALNRINVRKQWFIICELYKKSLSPNEKITTQSLMNKPYYNKLKQFFNGNKCSAKSKCVNQEFRKKMTVRLSFLPYADRWSMDRTNALINARIARNYMFKGRGHAALAWRTITEDVMQVNDPESGSVSIQQVRKKWENLFAKYKAMHQAQEYDMKWPYFEKMHHFFLEVYDLNKKKISKNEETQKENASVLSDRWPTSRTKLLIDRRIARASMFGRRMSSSGWQAVLDDLLKDGAPLDLTITSVKKKWENLLTRHKIIKDSKMEQTKWPHYDQMEKYHSLKKTCRRKKEIIEKDFQEDVQDEISILGAEILNKCRLCQQIEGNYLLTGDKNLCERIFEFTSINIYENMENLPTTICEICKDTIEKYYEFIALCQSVNKELKSDLKETVIKTENNPLILETLECSECPASFSTANALQIHLKSHKTNSKYHCEICSINFTKQSSLFAHIQQHFEIDQADDNVEIEYLDLAENSSDVEDTTSEAICEQFKCEFCSATFTDETNLKNHLETHSRIEHYCTRGGCNKKFTTVNSLRYHEMRHLGLNPFLCTVCGKGFVTKNALKMHEKIHLEVKEHVCEICSRGFSVLSNLRTHQKKHHEGHRFYCSQCPREFLTKCSLQRHELVHTGVKEFVCDICSTAFFTLKELKKHKRYHENTRLYHCNMCFKTFFEKHHLTIHIRSHTGERPFSCTISGCSKSFRERQKLQRHEKTHHKLSQPA